MSPLVEEVLQKLRELYPDIKIHIWEKFDRGKLFVNDHAIVTFNKDLIEKQLEARGKDSVNETVKFFAEYIETRYIKRKNHFTKAKGFPAYNLTRAQVEFAIANTESNAQAARFMNLNFMTWKKYAKKYGLYDDHIKMFGKGIQKLVHRPPTKMEDIFAGKHPNYDLYQFKKRLIREMILEEKCQRCGWTEKRKEDEVGPLVLDFIDNNPKNMSRENIRLVCYNCAFILHGKVNIKNMMRRNASVEKIIEAAYRKDDDNESVVLTPHEEKKFDDLFDQFNKK